MSTDHQVLGAIAKLQHQRAADISAFIISQEIEGATGTSEWWTKTVGPTTEPEIRRTRG